MNLLTIIFIIFYSRYLNSTSDDKYFTCTLRNTSIIIYSLALVKAKETEFISEYWSDHDAETSVNIKVGLETIEAGDGFSSTPESCKSHKKYSRQSETHIDQRFSAFHSTPSSADTRSRNSYRLYISAQPHRRLINHDKRKKLGRLHEPTEVRASVSQSVVQTSQDPIPVEHAPEAQVETQQPNQQFLLLPSAEMMNTRNSSQGVEHAPEAQVETQQPNQQSLSLPSVNELNTSQGEIKFVQVGPGIFHLLREFPQITGSSSYIHQPVSENQSSENYAQHQQSPKLDDLVSNPSIGYISTNSLYPINSNLNPNPLTSGFKPDFSQPHPNIKPRTVNPRTRRDSPQHCLTDLLSSTLDPRTPRDSPQQRLYSERFNNGPSERIQVWTQPSATTVRASHMNSVVDLDLTKPPPTMTPSPVLSEATDNTVLPPVNLAIPSYLTMEEGWKDILHRRTNPGSRVIPKPCPGRRCTSGPFSTSSLQSFLNQSNPFRVHQSTSGDSAPRSNILESPRGPKISCPNAGSMCGSSDKRHIASRDIPSQRANQEKSGSQRNSRSENLWSNEPHKGKSNFATGSKRQFPSERSPKYNPPLNFRRRYSSLKMRSPKTAGQNEPQKRSQFKDRLSRVGPAENPYRASRSATHDERLHPRSQSRGRDHEPGLRNARRDRCTARRSSSPRNHRFDERPLVEYPSHCRRKNHEEARNNKNIHWVKRAQISEDEPRDVGCNRLTAGQRISPTPKHSKHSDRFREHGERNSNSGEPPAKIPKMRKHSPQQLSSLKRTYKATSPSGPREKESSRGERSHREDSRLKGVYRQCPSGMSSAEDKTGENRPAKSRLSKEQTESRMSESFRGSKAVPLVTLGPERETSGDLIFEQTFQFCPVLNLYRTGKLSEIFLRLSVKSSERLDETKKKFYFDILLRMFSEHNDTKVEVEHILQELYELNLIESTGPEELSSSPRNENRYIELLFLQLAKHLFRMHLKESSIMEFHKQWKDIFVDIYFEDIVKSLPKHTNKLFRELHNLLAIFQTNAIIGDLGFRQQQDEKQIEFRLQELELFDLVRSQISTFFISGDYDYKMTIFRIKKTGETVITDLTAFHVISQLTTLMNRYMKFLVKSFFDKLSESDNIYSSRYIESLKSNPASHSRLDIKLVQEEIKLRHIESIKTGDQVDQEAVRSDINLYTIAKLKEFESEIKKMREWLKMIKVLALIYSTSVNIKFFKVRIYMLCKLIGTPVSEEFIYQFRNIIGQLYGDLYAIQVRSSRISDYLRLHNETNFISDPVQSHLNHIDSYVKLYYRILTVYFLWVSKSAKAKSSYNNNLQVMLRNYLFVFHTYMARSISPRFYREINTLRNIKKDQEILYAKRKRFLNQPKEYFDSYTSQLLLYTVKHQPIASVTHNLLFHLKSILMLWPHFQFDNHITSSLRSSKQTKTPIRSTFNETLPEKVSLSSKGKQTLDFVRRLCTLLYHSQIYTKKGFKIITDTVASELGGTSLQDKDVVQALKAKEYLSYLNIVDKSSKTYEINNDCALALEELSSVETTISRIGQIGEFSTSNEPESFTTRHINVEGFPRGNSNFTPKDITESYSDITSSDSATNTETLPYLVLNRYDLSFTGLNEYRSCNQQISLPSEFDKSPSSSPSRIYGNLDWPSHILSGSIESQFSILSSGAESFTEVTVIESSNTDPSRITLVLRKQLKAPEYDLANACSNSNNTKREKSQSTLIKNKFVPTLKHMTIIEFKDLTKLCADNITVDANITHLDTLKTIDIDDPDESDSDSHDLTPSENIKARSQSECSLRTRKFKRNAIPYNISRLSSNSAEYLAKKSPHQTNLELQTTNGSRNEIPASEESRNSFGDLLSEQCNNVLEPSSIGLCRGGKQGSISPSQNDTNSRIRVSTPKDNTSNDIQDLFAFVGKLYECNELKETPYSSLTAELLQESKHLETFYLHCKFLNSDLVPNPFGLFVLRNIKKNNGNSILQSIESKLQPSSRFSEFYLQQGFDLLLDQLKLYLYSIS